MHLVCTLDARAFHDGYNGVTIIVSGQCWISVFCPETSCLPFYHFRYSCTSLLSIVANSSNVSYAVSVMDAVLLGRLWFSSKGY